MHKVGCKLIKLHLSMNYKSLLFSPLLQIINAMLHKLPDYLHPIDCKHDSNYVSSTPRQLVLAWVGLVCTDTKDVRHKGYGNTMHYLHIHLCVI